MRNWNSLNFWSQEWNWQQRHIKWKQNTATLPVPWSSHAFERHLSNLSARLINQSYNQLYGLIIFSSIWTACLSVQNFYSSVQMAKQTIQTANQTVQIIYSPVRNTSRTVCYPCGFLLVSFLPFTVTNNNEQSNKARSGWCPIEQKTKKKTDGQIGRW